MYTNKKKTKYTYSLFNLELYDQYIMLKLDCIHMIVLKNYRDWSYYTRFEDIKQLDLVFDGEPSIGMPPPGLENLGF